MSKPLTLNGRCCIWVSCERERERHSIQDSFFVGYGLFFCFALNIVYAEGTFVRSYYVNFNFKARIFFLATAKCHIC